MELLTALALLVSLSSLIAANDSVAQHKAYYCAPNYCSSNTAGYTRQDVMGCMYFCYVEISGDWMVQRSEAHQRYMEWKGSAPTCNQDSFVAAIMQVIPVCENEAIAMYDMMKVLDGDGTDISGNDIEYWCEKVSTYGNDPYTFDGEAFEYYWWDAYPYFYDATCSLTYP